MWYTLPARTEDRATLRSDLSADPSHGRAAQQCRSFSRRAEQAALSCTKRKTSGGLGGRATGKAHTIIIEENRREGVRALSVYTDRIPGRYERFLVESGVLSRLVP